MPTIPFGSLPDDARVWIFAAAEPVREAGAATLLQAVDEYLSGWRAHGEPLTCARDWRDDRFLAIGVDQSTAGASGCSIDALFRILQRMPSALGTSLLGGARVYYRDPTGAVRATPRLEFARLMESGTVSDNTPVFDTTLSTAGAYRNSFERQLRDSWHGALQVRAQSSELGGQR